MAVESFNQLLKKEVDRKEFLLYIGLILFTLTGLSGVMRNLSTIIQGKQQNGFGSGPYGK